MKFMKLGSKPDSFQSKGNNIRCVSSDVTTDLIVIVGDVKFHLHKFPLLSKSARLQNLVANSNDENENVINISDIPGGPSAFEICAKFCYGMVVTLNAYNVIAVRCAAEYMEMNETTDKGNLIYKIEIFLTSSVLRGWKDSIIVLQTTKSYLPLCEELLLVSHCIESIASKACIDTSKVDWSYTHNRKKISSENIIESDWNGVMKQQSIPNDWWVEDLCDLDIDIYKRVIMAIKNKGKMPSIVIGEALKVYVYRKLPEIRKGVIQSVDSIKTLSLIETLFQLLPENGTVSCSFLFDLLKAGRMLDSGELMKKQLVKKIGRQLNEATVTDLLIPSINGEETWYDIDIIQTILAEFLMLEQNSQAISLDGVMGVIGDSVYIPEDSKIAVTKLIDGYLAEIAQDPNLPLCKFIDVAEMVSGFSRATHDSLYRAIDTYLKEHPGLSKSEKKMICRLMDCKKISIDACVHAIHNERLPLRVIVQVLYFVQMQVVASDGVVCRDPTSNISHECSRSVTTNTENWDVVKGEFGSTRLNEVISGGDSGDTSSKVSDKGHGNKVKGIMTPKKIFNRLWSAKGHSENSGSDASDSPSSVNQEETKSTVSRSGRSLVS